MQTDPRRRGISLTEVVVVLVVIVLLALLMIPSVRAARRKAQSRHCQDNLRALGAGLLKYAADYNYLCSGAFDFKHDGDFRKIGWVADMINGNYADASALKCPANPIRFSAQWNFACEKSTIPLTYQPREADPARRALQLTLSEAQDAYAAGCDTNYVASWYFVRTAMKPAAAPMTFMPDDVEVYGLASGTLSRSLNTSPSGKLSGCNATYLAYTIGPMPMGILENPIDTTPACIPLLADGQAAGPSYAKLTFSGLALDARKGDLGAASFTAGPVVFPDGFCGAKRKHGQDYRNFAPIHALSDVTAASILFGDSHVSQIEDRNRDGIIGYTGIESRPGESSELERIGYGSIVRWHSSMEIMR